MRVTVTPAGPRAAWSDPFPGDDADIPGKAGSISVQVQCPNWLDIDRVQVFVNGRPDPKLNFTRKDHPDKFGDGVVKFDQVIPFELQTDTHIIVAAIGEHSTLGPVMGSYSALDRPVAVSNPIYVDVDGDGFKANGDTLDAPLPVQ